MSKLRARIPRASMNKLVPSPSHASGWSSASALANMKNPSDMTADELGSACVAAAREQIDSGKFWSLVCDRASSLGQSMEPRELSLLLNGLSRTRQLGGREKLLESLEPVIVKKLAYFSSIQLAMTISALAKTSSASIPPGLVPSVVKEIKARAHELGTSVEFTMVLNALGRLGISDIAFSQRLGSVMVSKMKNRTVSFSSRDLCLIANAFSVLGVREVTLFSVISDRVIASAEDLSPLELAKLMLALARANMDLEKIVETVVTVSGPKIKLMSPWDLTNAVFSFGNVCEFVSYSENSNLGRLFDLIKEAIFACVSLFQVSELASVLSSLSRWRIPLKSSDKLVHRLRYFFPSRLSCDDMNAAQIVGSLYRIAPAEEVRELIELAGPVLAESLARTARPDWNAILRAMIACNELKLTNSILIDSLTHCVVKNRPSLDRHIAQSLADSLVNSRTLSYSDDLVLALRTC